MRRTLAARRAESLRALRVIALLALALTGVLLAPASSPAQAASPHWVYTIREGDTLITICRAYLRDPRAWPAVGRANGLVDPGRLRIGAKLRIPYTLLRTFAGTAYTVWTRGDVRAFSLDGTSQEVTPGIRLAGGSRIETGPQSGVRLWLIDGALLLVGERSRVVFDELTVYVLSGTRRTRISLDSGRIENRVVSPTDAPSQYQIKTPVITTAVRGTEFRVGVDGDGRAAHAEVVTGRMEVTAGGAQTAIEAGFGLVSRLGEPLGAPRPLPDAPDLSALPRRLERLPAQLSWPVVAAARQYRVQVGEVNGRGLIDQVVDGPTVQWPDLPDGTYRVAIRAIDDTGLEGRDAEAALTLDVRPEPPLVSAPRHGSVVYGDDAEFLWTRSDAATSYDFELADEPTFAKPLAVLTAHAKTDYARGLAPGVYYWRVASRTSATDRGPFGDAVSFTQRRYPAGREARAELAPKTLTLRWTSGQPGETAQFQFARDRTFDTPLLDRTTTELQISLPRPEPGTYFVRVRAIDDQETPGPFGPIQTIDVPPPPRKPWWPWLIVPAVAGALVALLR